MLPEDFDDFTVGVMEGIGLLQRGVQGFGHYDSGS
jgi:hypothetical protein